MFGKGGALSTWIKEFVELVFIQTLQAFIYAITISFVIKMIIQNHQTAGSVNTSLGIISIVALTAIFQIEDIVRKIMGFGPTKADRQGAIKSLAKTTIAFKLGKNLLDNGKKVVGGMYKAGVGAKDLIQAQKKEEEKREKLNKKYGLGTAGSADASQITSNENALAHQAYKNLTAKEKREYQEKYEALNESLKTKKAEYAKNHTEGLKNMASGIVETDVAWKAGMAGAIISGADGTWKDAARDGIALAGAADKMATGVINSSADVLSVLNKIRKDIQSSK